MKKLFYACLAILCLVLAYHFGATNVQGQSSSGLRAVGTSGGSTEPFIATDAAVWKYNNGWQSLAQAVYPEPPVAANQILYYGGSVTITTNGEGFSWINGTWVLRGLIPGGPTPTVQESWGGVKARYR